MILTTNLNDLLAVVKDPKYIRTIEAFVQTMDAAKFVHGQKVNLANNMSVIYINAEGTPDNENVLEAHRKFFDLHFTLEGNDDIVYKALKTCHVIRKEYDEEHDYMLFTETPPGKMCVAEGSYCLISPDYAHMALYGKCGHVKKLVFKIPVNG